MSEQVLLYIDRAQFISREAIIIHNPIPWPVKLQNCLCQKAWPGGPVCLVCLLWRVWLQHGVAVRFFSPTRQMLRPGWVGPLSRSKQPIHGYTDITFNKRGLFMQLCPGHWFEAGAYFKYVIRGDESADR